MDLAVNYIEHVASRIQFELTADHLPAENSDRLLRLYALLALSVGTECTLENVHDAWSIWMTEVDPSHESLVPFSELDPATQAEDLPYVEAIRRVSMRLSSR